MCAFPDALAPLPGGGVVVACRFDPALLIVTRVAGSPPWGDFRVRVVDAGPEHGHRGIAIDPGGGFVYVASPPRGGVKIVDLGARAGPVGFVATGLSPQTLRLVPPDPAAGRQRSLLLVSNVVGRTVTIHDVLADGGGIELSAARQTISTEAPVLDLAVVPSVAVSVASGDDLRGALLLLTHEDRPLSREHLSVEGLDSVVIPLRPAPPGVLVPFADPGPGHRIAVNLTERARDLLVGPDALAVNPLTGGVAIVGAGTDNLLLVPPRRAALLSAPAVVVGANPSAVAFLPDGRVVTADRLSDTLSFSAAGAVQTVVVGTPERPSPAEQGELLFYSRALTPNNVADGPLSVYTCAACHVDGEIDGRRHPSKRNRFFSMTKTCRGLQGTEPFLSLGKPDSFAAFADNIVATHAQGALTAPDSYDHYSLRLRLRAGETWTDVILSPDQIRAALAAHLARVPAQPSPFVAPGRSRLTATERRGFQTFRENCSGCHRLVRSTDDEHAIAASEIEARLLARQVVLTSAGLHDVGTPVLGEGGNNPPSLRGVWAAAPYFSDGSADTLDDVLRRTNPDSPKIHAAENATHPPAFSAATRADLLAFLRAL
jgi:hypothetical protein